VVHRRNTLEEEVRKNIMRVAVAAVVLALAACGQSSSSSSTATAAAGSSAAKGTVGVAMPNKSDQRWINDGSNMAKQFEALGYKVDLQYADNDVANQVSEIENMITRQDSALVVAAVDGSSLTDVLSKAADAKIPVIAYDRLILKSPNVDYYATFDNFKVGVLQGTYIIDKLGLAGGKGPFNVELFAGAPDDNNSGFFFKGAMSVLQPYIDSKKLVVASGQTAFDQITTKNWDGSVAQSRMDNLLSKAYATQRVDAVLSPYDGLSIRILSSLKAVGYGTAAKPFPIVTGQDAELASVKSIISGQQTQTVYKDTRDLAKVAVSMVDAVRQGKTPQTNDTTSYNNGVKVIPAYLLQPVSVDKSNFEQVLVGGGYYTDAQLKG
jgi:putative multiple sugar transport system substrate-binding protein